MTPHAPVVMRLVINTVDIFLYKKATAQLVTLMISSKMKALSSTTLTRSYALDSSLHNSWPILLHLVPMPLEKSLNMLNR
jgi:hypothetical protein